MLIKRVMAVAIFMGLASATPLYAGPWMQSEGDAVMATGAVHSHEDAFWTKNRDRIPLRNRVHRTVYYGYYEYGYSYYYTVFTSIAWTKRESGTKIEEGFSNIKLGIRGRLNPFRNGRTWEVTALIPAKNLGDPNREDSGGISGGLFYLGRPDPYETPYVPFTKWIWGGGIGVTLLRKVDVGKSMWAYSQWERGIINRSWKIGTQLDGRSSFRDEKRAFPLEIRDQITWEVSLGYRLSRETGLSIGYAKDIWGRNVTQSDTIKVGLSHSFR